MSWALVGDSICDDSYWLADKTKDLTYCLSQKGLEVHNLAVDESRISNILEGIKPNPVYVQSRAYPYPMDADGVVRPLPLLMNLEQIDMIVLSIGGNDLRVALPSLLFCTVDQFLNQVITPQLLNNLHKVLSSLQAACGKITWLLPYLPFMGAGSLYSLMQVKAKELQTKLFNLLLPLARQYSITLLDLSRSFDCLNRSHYGSTEIEPSNFSNARIADYLVEIAAQWSGFAVYAAPKLGTLQKLS